MNVLKFGGTSVGTVESLTHVKNIVEGRQEPVIVVVSALGGVTDMLINAADIARSGSDAWQEIFDRITERHRIVVEALVPENVRPAIKGMVKAELEKLHRLYTGISLLEDLSERTLCKVVSFGERASSLIVANIIENAVHFYSPDFIKTEKWFDRNIAVTDLTDRLIRETFSSRNFKVAVVPGFISTDRDNGDITNLGRGGSDYTAALIAASLNAETLEIWTDVDGFMTADPRIIKEASVIPHLSFLESMDLCNFGAKVIYPPTIYPVFHKNIPIRILNTFNSEAPGTYITDSHRIPVSQPFRGVTSIPEVSVLELLPTPEFKASVLRNRALNVLSKKGVEILLSVCQIEEERPVRIVLRAADAARAEHMLREDLSGEGKPDSLPSLRTITDMSTVTLVGENLKTETSAGERMLHSLHREGIEILTSGRGSSGFAMTAVIPSASMKQALRLLHTNFLS